MQSDKLSCVTEKYENSVLQWISLVLLYLSEHVNFYFSSIVSDKVLKISFRLKIVRECFSIVKADLREDQKYFNH